MISVIEEKRFFIYLLLFDDLLQELERSGLIILCQITFELVELKWNGKRDFAKERIAYK
jgi:hypothetical protein